MKGFITCIALSFILLISIGAGSLMAQFYNGHQMDFGKNRVQFDQFDWFFFRFNEFDTYYYPGGRDLALKTARIANEEKEEISDILNHPLNQRVIFVVYHNLSDFRQSNIGLETLNNQYNIGGVTKIVDNIVFLYVEGDTKKLHEQIKAAIAEITLNEILYGSDFTNKLANNTLLSTPEWFFGGLVSYLSKGWNPVIENKVKDGILSGRYEKFNHLTGENAVYAGHSIWYFIVNNYGENILPTILYMTRVSKNIESGFMYVLGTSLKLLSYEWMHYYKRLFEERYKLGNYPDGENLLERSRKHRTYQQAHVSPDGNYLAYTSNIMGKNKIFIKNIETEKRKKIYRLGHKLDQINDKTYPIIRWHPSGKLLGFMVEHKGGIYYYTYNLDEESLNEKEIEGFDKILSFDYSSRGLKIILNGFRNGQSDIFMFKLAGNTFTNLTVDKADDYHPVFIENDKKILFSSKRAVDSIGDKEKHKIPTQKFRDIFTFDLESPENTVTRITNTPVNNEKQAYQTEKNEYIYLSDKSGIYNRYSAKYDSIISYVDTITHYRHFTVSEPLTNYAMNILQHQYSQATNQITDLYYDKTKYHIFIDVLSDKGIETKLPESLYRKTLSHKEKQAKERQKQKKAEKPEAIDSLININNYRFDPIFIKAENAESDFDSSGNLKVPPQSKYLTSFYSNQVLNQVDFGFLNTSYQRFTGYAFYFNPGFNILLKADAKDLFEDYRITGGFRFSGNFDSNEYMLSFEDLKNRLNKQYIFHRQSFTNYSGNSISKSFSNQLMYVLRYPFSQVSAVQGTASMRQDKTAFLTTDYQNLIRENSFDYWGGLKLEYIFDNTRNISLNIYDGARMKFFIEGFKQINEAESDLFVAGCDIRYYLPIHRNLIFASRIAASSSWGQSKLVYYLGGIDNWINVSANTEMFDQSTRIDPEENYAYQAVATNMRGFSQNIRNGNSFGLFNAEIRWPVISYLFNRPINSGFLQHFQVVGFFDVGSAWTGLDPFAGDNAYETDITENGPITVSIDNESYPFVAGYGVGVRSRLLGYFVRLDYARGIENNILLPGIFYLSLSLDF